MRLNEARELVVLWMSDRPLIEKANSETDVLGDLICQEAGEAAEEYAKGDMEALKYEICDLLFFSMAMLHIAGIDQTEFEKAFKTKVARNAAKYPASMFQEGDYPALYQEARRLWKASQGDQDFLA